MAESGGESWAGGGKPSKGRKGLGHWIVTLLRGIVVTLLRTVKLIFRGLWRLVRPRKKPPAAGDK